MSKFSLVRTPQGTFVQSETEQDGHPVIKRESAFMEEDHALMYLQCLHIGTVTPLQVMQSNAGFYIGRVYTGDGFPVPFSRESVEYFASHEEAENALRTDNWTQRDHY